MAGQSCSHRQRCADAELCANSRTGRRHHQREIKGRENRRRSYRRKPDVLIKCSVTLWRAMKTCPKCKRAYDDVTLRFCLEDGTPLFDVRDSQAPPTEILGSRGAPTLKSTGPTVPTF